MKRLFILLPAVIFFGCEIYILEEPVPYDDRDAFIGSYAVEDYSSTTEDMYSYQISITKACCNRDRVWIQNFYGVDIDVAAEISGNRLTINRQWIGDYEVEGTGRIDYDQLSMTFVVRDHYYNPTFTDFVSSTSWRR